MVRCRTKDNWSNLKRKNSHLLVTEWLKNNSVSWYFLNKNIQTLEILMYHLVWAIAIHYPTIANNWIKQDKSQ